MQRFTQHSRFGISTKLFLLNLFVILILSGILVVVFVFFHNLDAQLTAILERDIALIIENAQSGREVTDILADLVIMIFYGQEEAETQKLEQLEQNIAGLIAQHPFSEAHQALQEFPPQLAKLLEKSDDAKLILNEMTEIENDFLFTVEILGDVIDELLEDSQEELLVKHLQQIQAMSTGYRDEFFKIIMAVNAMRRETAALDKEAAQNLEEHPVVSSIDYLLLRFQTLLSSEPEIVEIGEELIDIVEQYKDAVLRLQEADMSFQSHLRSVSAAKEEFLAALKQRDQGSIKIAASTQQNVEHQILLSRNVIAALSGTILIVLLLSNFYALRLMKPLVQLSAAASWIAKGEVDFKLPDVQSNDEIGKLAQEFHNMTIYLQEMTHVATQISNGDLHQTIHPRSARDLLGNAFLRMSDYLNDIASVATAIADGDLRQEIHPKSEYDVLGMAFQQMNTLRETIREIMSRAERSSEASEALREISRQMVAGAMQTSQQIHSVSENIQYINENAGEVSIATEELAASTREISRNTANVVESVTNAVDIANAMTARVNTLEQDSSEIGEIIKVITAVTQQTNLLALNASIEAARAGDVGKGFAVVADEVKELARQTAGATENIIHRIEAIQASSQQTADSIAEMSGIIHQVHELSDAIKLVFEQQTTTTNDISRNMTGVAQGSDEITRTVTEVAGVAHQASEQAREVERAAQELISLADQMRQLILQFKI